jgi:hypothetical protein
MGPSLNAPEGCVPLRVNGCGRLRGPSRRAHATGGSATDESWFLNPSPITIHSAADPSIKDTISATMTTI